MSRGKNSTKVNARLRQQLTEATEARGRLEARVVAAERQRDEAVRRMEDALDNGHPELREAIAREKHRESEILRLAAESEKFSNHLRTALAAPMKVMIEGATNEELWLVLTPEFVALMHELFQEDFYKWLGWASRHKLRDQVKWSPELLFASMQANRSDVGAGARRGLAAVEVARQRRQAAA
jgi:hypothetical protein